MNPVSYIIALFQWLIGGWGFDSNTPGIMIIAVSIGLIWLKRSELQAAPVKKDLKALFVIVPAFAAYAAGCILKQPLPGIMAVISLFWAITLLVWGRSVATLLFFPCAYLLFAVPGLLANLINPLKSISSISSAIIANGLGIEVFREGNLVIVPGQENVFLDIADECSGVRSFITLTALTAAYASVTLENIRSKWILFLSAIPLAIAGNIVRCVSIIIAAQALGHDIAIDYFHVYAPRIIFIINVLLMIAIGERLKNRGQKSEARSQNKPTPSVS